MRFAALSLFLLIHSFLGAQSTSRSLLWSISAPGDKDTSYLYGTIHSRDARAFRLQDSTLIVFDRCDMVAGELELDETRKMKQEVTNAMFLPKGSSLDRLYSKSDYKVVIGALKARLGPLAPLCTKVRPFYTIAMLSEMELGNDSAMVLDAYFQDRAMERRMKVAGLETINEQLEAVEKIPLREQAKLLLRVLLVDTSQANMNAAMAAYNRHDLDALMNVVDRDGLPEHADKALLQERNDRMAARLEKHIGSGHRVFAAIGAAHLPGERGLIEQMRARGFVVRPVGLPIEPVMAPPIAATPPREEWRAPLPSYSPEPPVLPAKKLKDGINLRNDTLGFAMDMPRIPFRAGGSFIDGVKRTTWVSGDINARPGVSVTTDEGEPIAAVDPRMRIEELLRTLPDQVSGPVVHIRVQDHPAIDYSTSNAQGEPVRCIIVVTPMRTHTFTFTGTSARKDQFAERVISSIRILEGVEGK